MSQFFIPEFLALDLSPDPNATFHWVYFHGQAEDLAASKGARTADLVAFANPADAARVQVSNRPIACTVYGEPAILFYWQTDCPNVRKGLIVLERDGPAKEHAWNKFNRKASMI